METMATTELGPNPTHPKRVTAQTLRLQHDYVLVRPLAPPLKRAGGRMFMPESAGERERNSRGVVLAVGPGDYNQIGTSRLPVEIQPGDLVFFGKYAGTDEEFDGQRLLVMRETEIRLTVPALQFEVVEHEDAKLNHLVEDWCDVCYGDPEAEAKERLETARVQLAMVKHASVPEHKLGDPCDVCDAMPSKEAERPRRPCLGGVGDSVCLGMQTLIDGQWVGARCGHTHPAEIEL